MPLEALGQPSGLDSDSTPAFSVMYAAIVQLALQTKRSHEKFAGTFAHKNCENCKKGLFEAETLPSCKLATYFRKSGLAASRRTLDS